MEIHFYESLSADIPLNEPIIFGWDETERRIKNKEERIHTTQMGLLNTSLFELGYKIFIHEARENGIYYEYEIKLGGNNIRTNREIKLTHNLFNLWKAGEFKRK